MDESVPLFDMPSKRVEDANTVVRTASLVGDPKVSALEALKTKDHQLLCDLLAEEDGKIVDVNATYEEEDDKTLLHIAVDRENVEAVKLLLSARAKVNVINRVLKTTPLHVAARKGNGEIFKLLLSYGADVNAVTSDGKTVLHILAKKCKTEENVAHLNCLKLAVRSRGCELDKQEKSEDLTAAMVALAENSLFDVIKVLAAAGADVTKRRNEIVSKYGQANYDALQSLSLEDAMLVSPLDAGTAVKDELRKLLDEADAKGTDNLQAFDDNLKLVTSAVDLIVAPPGELSVLQVAAANGLENHLKLLLDFPNMNPNVAPAGTCPALLLAAKRGKAEVLKVLKDHKLKHENNPKVFTAKFNVVDADEGSSVVHSILRKPVNDAMLVEKPSSDDCEYEKCLAVLVKDLGRDSCIAREVRLIINAKDTLGNTALHYATQLWSQSVVRLLLEMGANIAVKNVYGEVAINHILPETMESFLDESCLSTEGNVTNENFKIVARFDFLVPPKDATPAEAPKASGEGKPNCGGWIDPEQQPAKEGNVYLPETDGLWYMGQSKKHRQLLKHPVVALFLWMKWKRISSAYNRSLLIYAAFVACITGYIFTLYAGKSIRPESFPTEDCNPNIAVDNVDSDVLWYILVVLMAFLIGREVFQLGIAPRRYFFNVENWVEMVLIVLTGILLFRDGYGCHVSEKRHISAFVIVLSWAELITMIGRHPKLTTYNIYVTMFYKVMWTFSMFLVWYSLFIVAFALGFYILLHQDYPADDGAEYPFFDHLGTTLVKTFTMFVGELEFADLPVTTAGGYVFLLAFVFLIVVVMMNLLNGLAVSDTGLIKEEAEIHAYKCQVEIISYLEAYLLGDPFDFLSNWPTYVWLKHFPVNYNLVGGLYKIPHIRRLFNAMTSAKKILLFVDGGSNSITFYPNRNSFRCSSYFCCGGDDEDLDFPEVITESAKEVVLKLRRQQEEESDLERRLAGVELALERLLEKLGN